MIYTFPAWKKQKIHGTANNLPHKAIPSPPKNNNKKAVGPHKIFTAEKLASDLIRLILDVETFMTVKN